MYVRVNRGRGKGKREGRRGSRGGDCKESGGGGGCGYQ